MKLSITPERMARLKLWILMPTRSLNGLAPHHVKLLGTLRQHGLWYFLQTMPFDSLITRARNNLADIFYANSSQDNDHFSLWLDDDIVFDPEAVLQLLACDRDFIAAPYAKKGLHMDRIKAAAKHDWKSTDLPQAAGTPNVNFLISQVMLNEPTPVLEAGAGFWLVKRKVFRIMAESLDISYRRTGEEIAMFGRDTAHDFFRVGIWPETRDYLSEDWWMCRQWRALGGTVWCAFWIKTEHLGPYLYPMNMDTVIGLLSQTGGIINGPTYKEEEAQHVEPHDSGRTADFLGQGQRGNGTQESQGGSPRSAEESQSGSQSAIGGYVSPIVGGGGT